MIRKNFDTIKCILDLMIIFSPFVLLLDHGVEKFIGLFYLVYLPSLIISVMEIRYQKNESLFKKSIPIKSHITHPNKKTTKKELFIS
jgi:hypothetical protein